MGDPYVRATRERKRRSERRIWLVMAVTLAIIIGVVAVQSCTSGGGGQGDTPCQVGMDCE